MKNKKILFAVCLCLSVGIGVSWLRQSKSRSAEHSAAVTAGTNATAIMTNAFANTAPVPSAIGNTQGVVSSEMNPSINPYAAGLREPGKAKREWDERFIESFRSSNPGNAVRFELTGGVVAKGVVKIIQRDGANVSFVSGELSEPEIGKFFFLTPPAGGKAGKAVGVVEFPGSQIAYRVEPTGSGGEPELWERRMDEVLCLSMPEISDPVMAAAATNETLNIPPLRPDLVPDYVPSYNSNIVSLQSYPGSSAVLLLDFFGGYTVHWGGVEYARPPVSNETIKDIWKRVAEDYMPFNINVTTDIKVYQAAPAASRQRCCYTTTPVTAAGVAYFGSWNWGNDAVCWSVYYVGKNAAEVGSHEVGHTLGLSHDGRTTPVEEYFGGHGSGDTGWAPIMGVGYYQPVAQWSKGEYASANQLQDDLNIITSNNNNVGYRADDTGNTLATARYLEIYSNNTASAEGVIERTADTDAFQFTTSGGIVTLTAKPVGDWADLAVSATLANAADTVIASNNPQSTLSASITTNLAAGSYTFRVTGAGRNNPLNNGFSSYASLGYYSVTGSVAGARLPTRLSVVEHAPNNSEVGAVPAINPNSSPLLYTITSGNSGGTFSVDDSGVVRVADNTLLDYSRLATNTMYAVQFEVFMNITNVNNPALTELNRRVVIAVEKFYPVVPMLLTATAGTGLRINLNWMGAQDAISYNVKRSTLHNGPYTVIASPTDTSYSDLGLTDGVRYYYVVSAVNTNGESADSSEANALAQSVAGYGFETPSIGSGNHQYNPSGGFWTFNGASGNGSGIVANGSAFSNPNAPEGSQAAFVQSYGTISQTLSGFTPGVNYTITYSAAQRSGQDQHGGESWNVVVDGNVIKSNNPGPTSYTTYNATFIATATTHALAFVGTDLAGGDNTVFIDNVRFDPPLQPAPATVALTQPANGAGFAETAPIYLMATVTTNGNQIDGVEFYLDNITRLGEITTAPFKFAMANVTPGKHTVFARVLFNNGSVADSAPVDFFIISPNPNLSFELPAIGSGNHVYGPEGGTWIFNSNSGDNGSGIVANGSAFGNPNAPNGTQTAFVQSHGKITQTLTGFAPGTNYTLTYSAAQRGGGNQHGGESWNVMVDDAVIKSNTPGPTSYTTYTANFTASLATHTLSFVGTDLAGGDNTVFIDNVQFNPPLTPILIPELRTNTLPVTAAEVVGGEVKFMAAFNSANPIQYQWQKIVDGVATDIVDATNTVLTLTDLQLSDAGLYRLQASNALGIAVSAASSLTVSGVPAPVNNVITSFAAQTGLGSVATNFTPTWTLGSGSLIQGKTPSQVGGGNFTRSTALLTDGSFGWFTYWPNVGLSSTEVTCGTSAGQSVTYALGNSSSGYSISNIVIYGGWGDAGRDQQAFTVSYSTISAPDLFVPLANVNFNPENPRAVQSATRSSLRSSTGAPLATNVAKLKFDFTTPEPENGYCGYSEISVLGTPTPMIATTPTHIAVQFNKDVLNLSWPSDHIGWRLQVQTNDWNSGLGTNWVDVIGSTATNQMNVPINTVNGSVFFRLVYP